MLLELEELNVDYGGAIVLRGVSLGVSKGSIVCLIGANGAGKTTTLRTISGLKRAKDGAIKFGGKLINHYSPQEILASGIAQVPQEGKIFRDMSVYENLIMGAYLRSNKSEIAVDFQNVYGYFPILETRSKQRAGSLSGGERQMLAIGRALMSRPALLMMDEPTSGLAPMIVKMVGDIVLRLNRESMSIVLVEQNADLALKIARYGYVMVRGRISIEGSSADLLRNDAVREAYLGI